MQRTHWLITLLILTVLVLHLVPVMTGSSEYKWPFMAYCMYRNSRRPGPIKTIRLSAKCVTASGQQVEMLMRSRTRFFLLFRQKQDEPADLVAVNSYVLLNRYLKPMWDGDAFAAQRLADQINYRRNDRVVAFRLESETYTISDGGVAKSDNRVITVPVRN